MIKHLILLVVTVGLTVAATAQEELPVVLVAAKGKIKYTSTDGMTGKILTGAVLRRGGSLQLKKRTRSSCSITAIFVSWKGSNPYPWRANFRKAKIW